MKAAATIQELRELIREYRSSAASSLVGFVPTMGFLHEGHASLMEKARMECGFVVLSIFVNPLQFGPNEDFDRYPRDRERDLQTAEAAGVDVVFMPSVQEMYPSPIQTKITVSGDITQVLCGESRPGHFDGVATVVSKLLNIVQPDKAYFGMKDAQQVAVVTQMVNDLNIPVEIVPCPTIREVDGLAKSSRNVYLSSEERKQAVVLSKALELAGELLDKGIHSAEELQRRLKARIESAPLAQIDYVEVRQYPSLSAVSDLSNMDEHQQIIVALAVKFGSTRLIDNRLYSAAWKKR
jgi:pantoate--beta-alanine ligase